ncbi:Wadjet anti-phage system protein JetA family protein [Treponema zioleckii]|uniref:Wadjet anti-phage system protein JetA family protein n=1 Tax=Treponema zioleckii TaxID=331680 RepID=UPI00168ABD4C|nr:Wadjet anti-phage system protein JetA family protein [Treponema zioleckii]
MKNLFSVVPADFFKPLNSQYKDQYADCLLAIYNSYRTEISYGVDRESIVSTLTDYFNSRTDDISFDDESESIERDARSKAQKVINYLKNCGWLDFEDEKDYKQNVVLTEVAVPFIRTMNDVIKNEETEYQGLISQIHAVLQNEELYSKPYQFILKNVVNSTEQLVSSLKKLNISIKKHIDKQTKNRELKSVLDLFESYNEEIVSKSLYRLKTSENIGRFRQSIKRNLDKMLGTQKILDDLVAGYMEIEQEKDSELAKEKIIGMIIGVKDAFENLDRVIDDIDRKNNRYMKNAASRAKFELSSGTNQAGKINMILRYFTEVSDSEENIAPDLFNVFVQKFVSEESVKKIPAKKSYDEIESIRTSEVLSVQERELKKKLMLDRQMSRIYRKKVESFVSEKFNGRNMFLASEIPVQSRKDFEKLIYIRLFALGSKVYSVKKTGKRVKTEKCEFTDFEIIRKNKKETVNV